MHKKTVAGFTLIEMLVATAILMILSAMLITAFTTWKSSRNVRVQSASGVEKAGATAAVKHLYVISAYSGQVIIHSAIRGDVETFGREMEAARKPGYLRWRDIHGASHELYVSDLTVIHISSDPMELKGNNPGAETAPRLEAEK